MNQQLKQRLVGAVVLAAIAVLFLPSLIKDNQPYRVDTRSQIPPAPAIAPLRIETPRQPADIEPAPAPETMFLSADEQQPVVESLEDLAQASASSAPAARAPAAESRASSAPSSGLAVPEAWVVQVASLSSAEAAGRLRDRLQAQGHQAYIRTATTANGEVSRVFIGPKIEREEALRIKAEVDQLLRVNSLVVRFQP